MYTAGGHLLAASAGLFVQSVLGFSNLHHAAGHIHCGHVEKRLLGLPLLDSLNLPLRSNGGPVEVTGDHEWRAPVDGDQRGPCPGLNALANHGYIARDGIATLLGVVPAINQVYGMSLELALLLAVMGTVWCGNLLSLGPSFSIGGPDPDVQNLLGNALGLLGEPRGIDHSHNFIEADSSPTRDDLYETGDPVTMNLNNFKTLYDMIPESSNDLFTLDVLIDFAAIRFNQSIATNPYFYYGPVSGTIARNTGFCFVANFFANYSSGKPELTHNILKSFFAVSGDRDDFVYTPGHERIPANWVGRQQEYGLLDLNLNIVQFILRYPVFASIGGNLGKVNSFTGVNLADPAAGVLGVTNLLQGNNLLCFALELVNFAAPNYLNNLVTTLVEPLKMLTEAIAAPLLNMSCPQLDEITRDGVPLWESLGAEFPGANRSGIAL